MPDVPVPPFYAPPRWEAASIAAVGIAGYLLLAHILGEGRGTAASGFVTSFDLALRIGWPLRKQLWFWLVWLGLGALHAIAVLRLNWSVAADWNGSTFIPFIVADTVLVLVVIYGIYRWRYGVPAELVGEPDPRYSDAKDCPID